MNFPKEIQRGAPILAFTLGVTTLGILLAVGFGGLATVTAMVAAVALPAITTAVVLLSFLSTLNSWLDGRTSCKTAQLICGVVATIAFFAAAILMATGGGVPFAGLSALLGCLALGFCRSFANK